MKWQRRGDKLFGANGETYELFPHEYWYAAPSRTAYRRGERVRPLEFAFALNNAALGEGLLISPIVLMNGFEPGTEKGGAAAEAEALLETLRCEKHPNRPSRLCSYFLNYDRATAEFRAQDSLRRNRALTPCFLVGGGRAHFADAGIYERLEGRPDDASLAEAYWQTFTPRTPDEALRLEILTNTALYFPEWATFPILESEVLVNWQVDKTAKPNAGG